MKIEIQDKKIKKLESMIERIAHNKSNIGDVKMSIINADKIFQSSNK